MKHSDLLNADQVATTHAIILIIQVETRLRKEIYFSGPDRSKSFEFLAVIISSLRFVVVVIVFIIVVNVGAGKAQRYDRKYVSQGVS